jgi:hypothetical protein
MRMNVAGEPLAPTNGFDQVRQAFQAWSTVTNSTFHYQDGGFTDAQASQLDGVNTVSFRDPLGQMDPPVGCAGVLAVGGFYYNSETRVVNGTTFSRIVDGGLVFNDGWDGCGFYENFASFAEVATHELGHVLGLGHSTDATATMYYRAHFDGRGAALRQDDFNGLRAIYPSPIVTSLTADKASPQLLGTPITFTATATGGVAPYQYKWWVYNGSTWTIGQGWGASNSFTWTPTAPANYRIQVWTRNSGTTSDTAEAYQSLVYTATVP